MPEDISTGRLKYSNSGNLQDKSLPAKTLKSVPRDVHAPGINLHPLVDTARNSIMAQMNICSDLHYGSLNS